MTPKLRRICGGLYESIDGKWQIERGDPGSGWAGEWIVRHATSRDIYSDPVPTLRVAREVLESMIDAKAAGRI